MATSPLWCRHRRPARFAAGFFASEVSSMDESKTFLSQVKGFTPVIDALANELGIITALVYGLAWRFCAMEDHVCSASHETIGKLANISPKTVQRHLHKLAQAGYLRDLTPGRRNAPQVYGETGQAQI